MVDLKDLKRRIFWSYERKVRELEWEISGFVLESYEYHDYESRISGDHRETLRRIYEKYRKLGLDEDEIFQISERKARIIHRDLVIGLDSSVSRRQDSGDRAILVYQMENEIEY